MKKALVFIIVLNIVRFFLIPFFGGWAGEWIYTDSVSGNHTFFPSVLVDIASRINMADKLPFYRAIHFLIALFTQWAFLLLISKIIRPVRKYSAWALIAGTLSVTVVSVTAIHDTFLLLFWTLSLLVLYNAIFNDDKKSWVLGGLFMGFAILNKLSGFALPAGLILFLIFSSRYRKYIYTPFPYMALLIAGIFAVPVLNGMVPAENIYIQLNQIENHIGTVGINTNSFNVFLISQLVLMLPILYIGLWWVTFKYLGRIFIKPNQINAELWFLLSFFLPLFLGFHLISIFNRVDALGLIPVYVSGLIVLLKLIKPRWTAWAFGFTAVAHLLLITAMWVL